MKIKMNKVIKQKIKKNLNFYNKIFNYKKNIFKKYCLNILMRILKHSKKNVKISKDTIA